MVLFVLEIKHVTTVFLVSLIMSSVILTSSIGFQREIDVTILSPNNNETISEFHNVKVYVESEDPITHVELVLWNTSHQSVLAENMSRDSETIPIYSFKLDLLKIADGLYTLEVTAYTVKGPQAIDSIKVTIENDPRSQFAIGSVLVGLGFKVKIISPLNRSKINNFTTVKAQITLNTSLNTIDAESEPGYVGIYVDDYFYNEIMTKEFVNLTVISENDTKLKLITWIYSIELNLSNFAPGIHSLNATMIWYHPQGNEYSYSDAIVVILNGRVVEDTDDDGLTDVEEVAIYGTNSNTADTDGDGLADGEEVNTYDTDPTNVDTDGDGLSDGEEVDTYRTDPTNVDTDSDGLSDEVEVKTHETNPLSNDTDKDGILDGDELHIGTNPLKHDSDHDFVKDGVDLWPLYNNIRIALFISTLFLGLALFISKWDIIKGLAMIEGIEQMGWLRDLYIWVSNNIILRSIVILAYTTGQRSKTKGIAGIVGVNLIGWLIVFFLLGIMTFDPSLMVIPPLTIIPISEWNLRVGISARIKQKWRISRTKLIDRLPLVIITLVVLILALGSPSILLLLGFKLMWWQLILSLLGSFFTYFVALKQLFEKPLQRMLQSFFMRGMEETLAHPTSDQENDEEGFEGDANR